ncbi:hypothetical protein AVEN_104328-1 [Araneus ventricosus]|uniref:Uncharacterized protein n=1 Tax=Araneus ventricosus TaxID=182803 RepID=A0A4Y2BV61_ARAVE|nr:hypothetical protein AVEN_104328-1 [Araneus ventricosus]
MNVLNSTELQKVVSIFRDENACSDDIDEAGQKVLIALYGGKNSKKLRFKLIQKSLVKNNFNLASLPPTTAAAREHSPCIPTGYSYISAESVRVNTLSSTF